MCFRHYQFLRSHILLLFLIIFYAFPKQPLDLTTKGVVKMIEQCEYSNYFTTCITKALLADPKQDITTIKVDFKLSILKPIHAKTVSKVFNYLKSDEGKQIKKVKKTSFLIYVR